MKPNYATNYQSVQQSNIQRSTGAMYVVNDELDQSTE